MTADGLDTILGAEESREVTAAAAAARARAPKPKPKRAPDTRPVAGARRVLPRDLSLSPQPARTVAGAAAEAAERAGYDVRETDLVIVAVPAGQADRFLADVDAGAWRVLD